MASYPAVSTGWESLDRIIDHLRPGDNVVWQVDTLDDYQRLVTDFVNCALASNRRVVYLRFGRHLPMLADRRDQITVYQQRDHPGADRCLQLLASTFKKRAGDLHRFVPVKT